MVRLAICGAILAAACGSTPSGFADGGAPGADGGVAADGGAGGTWSARASLPSARQEIAAAVLGDDLYVVGGLVLLGGRTAGTREVLRYRPADNAWTRLADYPVAVDHAAAVALAGRVYVLGGSENFQPSAPLAEVWAYDPQGNLWEQRAGMPSGRWAPAAAVASGRIYVGGGLGPSPRTIFEYDPDGDAWRTLPGVLLTARDHLGAAEVGGKVYFVGGRVGAQNLDVVEELDPALPSLAERARMPTARGGLGVAALSGRVYALGGETFTLPLPGGVYPHVEVYDPAANGWTRATDMKTPRHGLGVVAAGGVLYAIGGGTSAGLGPSAVVEAFTP